MGVIKVYKITSKRLLTENIYLMDIVLLLKFIDMVIVKDILYLKKSFITLLSSITSSKLSELPCTS